MLTLPEAAKRRPGGDPGWWWSIDRSTTNLPAPLGILQLDAFTWNLADLERRANGTPLRLATKSVRVRELIPAGSPVRVAIELDASYRAPLLGHIGARRSPLHTPEQLAALARHILAHPGVTLVGIMAYEAQIAGVGNAANPAIRAMPIRAMQAASAAELAQRRALMATGIFSPPRPPHSHLTWCDGPPTTSRRCSGVDGSPLAHRGMTDSPSQCGRKG